jgi:thioredoxin-dependent peroxiredoxin
MTARLAPGDQAPEFILTDDHGNEVALSDYTGRPVILFAYPAAMTAGCTTEACDFRDSVAALSAAGYSVIGISPDKPEKNAKFRDKEGLTYPLLSDVDHAVLSTYGAYGEKLMYGQKREGVIRSTFVIDSRGIIQHALYNVRATGHVARLLDVLGL